MPKAVAYPKINFVLTKDWTGMGNQSFENGFVLRGGLNSLEPTGQGLQLARVQRIDKDLLKEWEESVRRLL